MSKRDRLKSYRKNAAAGKLDQKDAPTESPDVANDATTRKDSVEMDNGTASTLKKMMQGVLGAGVKIKPENSFGAINTLLSVFGMRLELKDRISKFLFFTAVISWIVGFIVGWYVGK